MLSTYFWVSFGGKDRLEAEGRVRCSKSDPKIYINLVHSAGVYDVEKMPMSLWELTSDHYLHHQYPTETRPYTAWWELDVWVSHCTNCGHLSSHC